MDVLESVLLVVTVTEVMVDLGIRTFGHGKRLG